MKHTELTDLFCRLVLESELTEQDMLDAAARALQCFPEVATSVHQMLADLRTMTAIKFAAHVQRSANGNAVSTRTPDCIRRVRDEY